MPQGRWILSPVRLPIPPFSHTRPLSTKTAPRGSARGTSARPPRRRNPSPLLHPWDDAGLGLHHKTTSPFDGRKRYLLHPIGTREKCSPPHAVGTPSTTTRPWPCEEERVARPYRLVPLIPPSRHTHHFDKAPTLRRGKPPSTAPPSRRLRMIFRPPPLDGESRHSTKPARHRREQPPDPTVSNVDPMHPGRYCRPGCRM